MFSTGAAGPRECNNPRWFLHSQVPHVGATWPLSLSLFPCDVSSSRAFPYGLGFSQHGDLRVIGFLTCRLRALRASVLRISLSFKEKLSPLFVVVISWTLIYGSTGTSFKRQFVESFCTINSDLRAQIVR